MKIFHTKPEISKELFYLACLSILLLLIPPYLPMENIMPNEKWGVTKNILQGLGSSMIATILFYIFYSFRMDKLVAETNQETARELIAKRFFDIMPEKIYEDTPTPSKKFDFDFNEKFTGSHIYYYKGPTGKTTSIKIYELKKNNKIIEDTIINFIVLNPSIHNDAFVKLAKKRIKSNMQNATYENKVDAEIRNLKTDIFFTLYILFSISHEVKCNVFFSDSMPLLYIQSMSEGLFISFETDKNLPQTYFYNKATTIHRAYLEELEFLCEKCNNSIHFNNMKISDFISKLKEYNFEKLLLEGKFIEDVPFASEDTWMESFEKAIIKRQEIFSIKY